MQILLIFFLRVRRMSGETDWFCGVSAVERKTDRTTCGFQSRVWNAKRCADDLRWHSGLDIEACYQRCLNVLDMTVDLSSTAV
jgi:hypothetical protein